MATNDGILRIEPVYDGSGTAVTQYKVVNELGIVQVQGDYSNCYYYLFPDVDNNYSDKEAFDEAWKDSITMHDLNEIDKAREERK